MAPALAILLLEAGLRIGGYGYPTGYFIKTDTPNLWRTNERFGWRFFPRAIAREPGLGGISAKPAGVIRIFVLGSSAAQGIPDPAYSFSRILEVMLRRRFPGARFEVVNAAMTAINSHVVLEVARDVAAFEPDMVIVYEGNNEVIGPYGPGTVFQSWSPSLWMIRARSRLAATRVGQLVANVATKFRPAAKELSQWQGLTMFANNPVAADDPRLTTTYDNFRKNLTDICRVARNAGAKVVLSTVAVNLEDCPPMGSQHRSGLAPEDLKRWDALYKEGSALESAGKGPEAMAKFLAAEKIDGTYAELPFRLGRLLAGAGDRGAARDRFAKARDLDVMRFRTDSRENAIIRAVAAQQLDGVILVDSEKALATCGIPDNALFYEHVHFMFEGNYQVARAMLDPVCQVLHARMTGSPAGAPVPSKAFCAERLAVTAWDESKMGAMMTGGIVSRPPFTSQLDHALRMAADAERMNVLCRLATTPEALQRAWKTYEAALAQCSDDWQLREHFAALAMQCDRPDEAARQGRAVVEKLPWAARPKARLGKALMAIGKFDEAIEYLEQAVRIKPNSAEAQCGLGAALGQKGKIQEALVHLEEAVRLNPDVSEVHTNLGKVLAIAGKTQEAFSHLEYAVLVSPSDLEAQANFGDALLRVGRLGEAIERLEQVLRLNPEHVATRCSLGVALVAKGEPVRAAAQYAEALRLKPDFPKALNDLAFLRATCADPSLRDGPEAVRLASRVCQITGRQNAGCLDTLAAAYAEAGQFSLAVQTAEEALVRASDQPGMAADIRQKLAMYKSGQPFRDKPPATRPKP